MTDKAFRTPKRYRTAAETPKFKETSTYYTPRSKITDSDESTTSDAGSTCSDEYLSIVAEYDDLFRFMRQLQNHDVMENIQIVAKHLYDLCLHAQKTAHECRRLQTELDSKTHENSDLVTKLGIARKLLDQERRRTKLAEEDKHHLETQFALVRDVLLNDYKNHLPDETRQRLSFLDNTRNNFEGNNLKHVDPQLSVIPEGNTTGSILSDLSYSRSEDDLDVSVLQNGVLWKKHRPSGEKNDGPAPKKRRSSNKVVEIGANEKVRATTTLTVSKDGPITATSIIESVPQDVEMSKYEKFTEHHPTAPTENMVFDMWQRNSPFVSTARKHYLQAKMMVIPDSCGVCDKRIRFGKSAMKCRECRTVCHSECKDNLPLPCIPVINTPLQRGLLGNIGDYTPTIPPMVPALIVHCINEIENRGLHEVGIYRVSASEKDVKALKDRFLRGKGAPCINQIDVHVLCGTVKDFLRTLNEPIVTYKLWGDFVNAIEAKDKKDIVPSLYQIISELPQPNRDTLAYIILHLKRVAEAVECKMTVSNLAMVFGPTIVGYSSADPSPSELVAQTSQQATIIEYLMHLPSEYWSTFVNVGYSGTPNSRLQQTPSTDSLLRQTNTRFFSTPHGTRIATKRSRQKFFPTPPNFK